MNMNNLKKRITGNKLSVKSFAEKYFTGMTENDGKLNSMELVSICFLHMNMQRQLLVLHFFMHIKWLILILY